MTEGIARRILRRASPRGTVARLILECQRAFRTAKANFGMQAQADFGKCGKQAYFGMRGLALAFASGDACLRFQRDSKLSHSKRPQPAAVSRSLLLP